MTEYATGSSNRQGEQKRERGRVGGERGSRERGGKEERGGRGREG
jgi:hypothetical protein